MAGLGLALHGVLAAATFEEDFVQPPSTRGWQAWGDASLFEWQAESQQLAVTWDSSRPNSFFHRSLGTIVTRHDDFRLAFDLQLQSVAAGTTPGKPFTFELAIGFLRLANATNTAFRRGVGRQFPNLVEFDYFPDWGAASSPTIWSTVVSTNGHLADEYLPNWTYAMEPLPLGETLRVELTYSASAQTLTTTVTGTQTPSPAPKPVFLTAEFPDFRVDTVAISSYSDAGGTGSIRAAGRLDNFQIVVADPPVSAIRGEWSGAEWQVTFLSQTNWVYSLQRSQAPGVWTPLQQRAGTGDSLTLTDVSPPAGGAFYRVAADRP